MMKRTAGLLTAGVAALMTTVVSGQELSPAERHANTELKLQVAAKSRFLLETRLTKGKPYSGDAITEFVHVLGDGNRIVRKSMARVYRDAEGRTRRETISETGSSETSIVITDPVAGTSWILDPDNRTAQKAPAMLARVEPGMVSGNVVISRAPNDGVGGVEVRTGPSSPQTKRQAEIIVGAGPASTAGFASTSIVAKGSGESTNEELGEQVIEGVTAKGTRTTTIIATGEVGNEQPITIISEQWFSPDLEVLVLTRHSDPRVGETTYRLTNLVRGEPDRSLFQPPADYTIKALYQRKW